MSYEPADKALLLAAGNIADLYLLHGNEAFADAFDPTIGLTTDSTALGSMASSVFAFQNQVSTLIEEELAMLRGRDDTFASVGATPVYNRLFWNFTGNDGEAAYVASYGIPDQNSDGFVNAGDARILFRKDLWRRLGPLSHRSDHLLRPAPAHELHLDSASGGHARRRSAHRSQLSGRTPLRPSRARPCPDGCGDRRTHSSTRFH